MVLIRALSGLALALGLAGTAPRPMTGTTTDRPSHRARSAAPSPPDIGGPFRLIDQFGRARSEADPDGRPQLLFFGYATCPGICSAVLPQLAALTDRLAETGVAVTPVLVTVDPTLDTVESLARRGTPDPPAPHGSDRHGSGAGRGPRRIRRRIEAPFRQPRARPDPRPRQLHLPARPGGPLPDPAATDPLDRAHGRDRHRISRGRAVSVARPASPSLQGPHARGAPLAFERAFS
jgi:hypothetical protein